MKLTAAEIEARLPLWAAMSNLFLDTEVDHRQIAEAVRSSGFTLREAETILRKEVFPAFVGFLHPIAGEWISWDEAEVREIMLQSLSDDRKSIGA